MGDAAQKETSHGNMDHRLGDIETPLEITDEATPADQPTECALNHPPARKHFEAGLAVDATHDLDDEVEERRLVEQLRPVVGAIGEQMLDPRPTFADRVQYRLRAGAVSNIGRRQVHHQKAAIGIDCDVALATDDLLVGIVAASGCSRRLEGGCRVVPVGTMGEVISLRVRNRQAAGLQVAKQIETPRPPDPILRRPRADREEKRVIHGRDTSGRPTAVRYVTKGDRIPTGRKPDGDQPMTNAERQARYRARHATVRGTISIVPRPNRPVDRRSRPKRWRDAVAVLLTLQAEYADWLAALPKGLHDGPMAEALEDIVNFDLDSLADIDPPRGYGRD